MAEAVFIVAALAFIVLIVALYVAAAALRARFVSWILGRVARSKSWIGGTAAPDGTPEEPARHGLGAMFDVMEGRPTTDEVTLPKRTGASPTEAGTAIENLGDRDPK